FFPHIEAILKEENLPLDLKYVPIVESALRPHAKSTASAVGYWQFLKSTGKRYGLVINRGVDERRNIFKSTRAACKYIHKLYGETKSYPAALAGYNMGEYGLLDEIESQKTRDYFSLYLPLETQRYVYKIIAAKLIMESPENYGFMLEPEDLYPVFSFSKVGFNSKKKIPLQMIAEAAGISFKRLKEFNPDIRGYNLSKGRRTVLVPQGREIGFKGRFNRLYAKWSRSSKKKIGKAKSRARVVKKAKKRNRYYRVRSGDTLSGIARRHRVPLKKLLKMNRFSSKKIIRPGDRVQIR
ncbi:MAG: transglycosylase SLT domain-containing protein, partial [Desulfovibrionales bacterium]|nr:transglycosylase SLT domain-containing protein [Desulfovibrionales bacterium]